ncbi:MAG: hypothetical protein IPH11_12400 [Ignavibacteriales bacterium]|nr:hypothetical protein [Ignavibacteriales bacterium]
MDKLIIYLIVEMMIGLGTTIDKPWKTLMRVKRAADQSVFKHRDIISFKRVIYGTSL